MHAQMHVAIWKKIQQMQAQNIKWMVTQSSLAHHADLHKDKGPFSGLIIEGH